MPKPGNKQLKLNLGSGTSRFEGYINVDCEKKCKPDVLCNFIGEALPYKDNSVDEILFFHTIEHIQKAYHKRILLEVHRVLKPIGVLYISYPEFTECVKRWEANYRGMRDFWEKTIFGRQLYPSDHHVCIMHTPDFMKVLGECGLTKVSVSPEPAGEAHNTMLKAHKGVACVNYEEIVLRDMTRFKLVKG